MAIGINIGPSLQFHFDLGLLNSSYTYYIYRSQQPFHSCCWSKLMEEGEKSQLIFGRNVAGNNFMHAKTELSEEGSLFSARAHVYLRWQSARKSSSKHTHSILLVWILLKYKLNILPSINFGVWMFRITYYN